MGVCQSSLPSRCYTNFLADATGTSSAGGSGSLLDGDYGCACIPTAWDFSADSQVVDTEERVFGVRWTAEEFLRKASMVHHPFEMVAGVDTEQSYSKNLKVGQE